MTKAKEDGSENFWNEWLKSDSLKQEKLLEKTMLVRELSAHLQTKLKGKRRQSLQMATSLVNGYFQDLACFLESKHP